MQLFKLAVQPVQFIEIAGEEFAFCLGYPGRREPVPAALSEQMSRLFRHEIGVESGLGPALHTTD